jgi:hypothetical protein
MPNQSRSSRLLERQNGRNQAARRKRGKPVAFMNVTLARMARVLVADHPLAWRTVSTCVGKFCSTGLLFFCRS